MKTRSPAEDEWLPPLVAIVGPTAVGKTALSIGLAEAVGGEIVSADSRQVYRGMDVGTAKATPGEQGRVPHHLIDILPPDAPLSLAQFQELAYHAIEAITDRGRVPFLVGGTGQYVMAVVEGWKIPRVPPQEDLRRKLYHEAEELGAEALHARLAAVDPEAAEGIDARNVRRVVRALEVCLVTGEPISAQQGKSAPPYHTLMIGLSLPRPALYGRIDDRVERMFEKGLEAEVRRLVAAGYGFDLPAMSGVGYGQFEGYLEGEKSLDEVKQEIKRATRRFVRQQANWFRDEDPRIHWFEAQPDPYPMVLELVQAYLARPAAKAEPG
jgi:tRNA dimethylallyltransferase